MVGNEGESVKVVCTERNILRESDALNSGYLPYTFGQQFVELLRLRCVVLNQTRIEAGHQQMIFSETGVIEQASLEAAGHEERGSEKHERGGDLSHHEQITAPKLFASGQINITRLESIHQVGTRALQRGSEAAEDGAQGR